MNIRDLRKRFRGLPESNKINGHIYAIPLTNAFYDIEVVYIRKDLREKFGMQPIQSYDDLKAYLEKFSNRKKV